MVDAHDSKSCLERGEGSSPFSGTINCLSDLQVYKYLQRTPN